MKDAKALTPMRYGRNSRLTKRLLMFMLNTKAAKEAEEKLAGEVKALQEFQTVNEQENLELLRKREMTRIKELEARAQPERIKKEQERRKAEDERKRQEANARVN